MVKPPLKTEAVTSTQIAAVASELKRLAEMLVSVAETAKSQPDSVIAVYNWASCETGLSRVQAFVNDAHKAKTLAEMGNPREVGLLKPRSTAKKAKEMLDTAVKKTTAHRKKPKS